MGWALCQWTQKDQAELRIKESYQQSTETELSEKQRKLGNVMQTKHGIGF